MKEDEISNKQNNKTKDKYELEVDYKAGTWAAVAMLILACVYYSYEIFTGKGSNPAFYSLIALYCSIFYGFRGFKIEKNRKLNIIISIIWGILSIMLIVAYFMK